MTDVETRLRDGLAALAEAIEPSDRPAPVPARRRRHRWAVVAPAIVGGLALSGVAAAATGTLPDGVERTFRDAVGWGHSPDVDPAAARLVATTTYRGTTYQYWVSQGVDGGRCEYLRYVRDGEPENGWRQCLDDGDGVFGDPNLFVTGSTGVPTDQGQYAGRVPPTAARVVLTFDDGTVLRLPVQTDGYFVVGVELRLLDGHTSSLVALDAAGEVVARRDY